MKQLSLLLLFVFMLTSPSCKYFHGKGWLSKKDRAQAYLKAQQDSLRVADSLRKVQEQLLLLETARQDSIRLAEEKKLSDIPRYSIIVGSFITPAYATALAREYNQNGFNTRILKVDGSRFELVSAEAYNDLSKAKARLARFRDTVELDSWIYVRR
jgi:hypothetical protein